MIFYFFIPFIVLGLIVLQLTLADIFFSGRIALELSLIFVIYAGFRMDLVRGIILAAITGFILDCLSCAVVGLFTFIYLVVFTLSFFVSLRVVSEKKYFIALFSLFCCALEFILVSLFYRFVLKYDMPGNVLMFFLLQASLISVLSVGFFYAMRSVEGLTYGKAIQSPQRPGTNGISPEA